MKVDNLASTSKPGVTRRLKSRLGRHMIRWNPAVETAGWEGTKSAFAG
jgi:hypothetical protein